MLVSTPWQLQCNVATEHYSIDSNAPLALPCSSAASCHRVQRTQVLGCHMLAQFLSQLHNKQEHTDTQTHADAACCGSAAVLDAQSGSVKCTLAYIAAVRVSIGNAHFAANTFNTPPSAILSSFPGLRSCSCSAWLDTVRLLMCAASSDSLKSSNTSDTDLPTNLAFRSIG